METWILVHLHLQQHHRKLRAAAFSAASALARPQNTIKAVAQFLDFKGFKTVELITGSRWGVSGLGRGRSGKPGSTSGRCSLGLGRLRAQGEAQF